jgi:hypothetical protein
VFVCERKEQVKNLCLMIDCLFHCSHAHSSPVKKVVEELYAQVEPEVQLVADVSETR